VTFFQTGIYQLQLSANDGVSTSTDFVTVFVDSQPSLAGANLNLVASNPGPLVDGTALTLTATLLDSAAHPIPSVAVKFDVAGANAQSAYAATNASGVAQYTYAGANVGTDVVTATALGAGGTPTNTLPGIEWLPAPPSGPAVVTQGWIGSPTHQSTVTGQVPITIGSGVTLTSGTVTYWPMSAPEQVHTLATGVTGGPGTTVATLDTTLLSNGMYVVQLDATNDSGQEQVSAVAVTASGDYKPGRVVVDVTDMTIPLPGMPVTVGRRYDSLEKDNVGDFGHGWSLTVGHPKLEVDPAHNVTMTMPDGRRVTYYFQPTPASASIVFSWLYTPQYVPELGTYGSLTSDGCSLLVQSGGQVVCFLDSSLDYAPTTYTYTDPYGRVYVMDADGTLKSITDRRQNSLTFAANGIVSNSGVSVKFVRDSQGRITKVTSPPIDGSTGSLVYTYDYNAPGDLTTAHLPTGSSGPATVQYAYSADHRLLTTKDANGNFARTSTYDAAGRLATDTDAAGNVTSYAYDLLAHLTTTTNPDQGTVAETFDERGLLLKEVDPLGRTTEHTYDAHRNELTRKNPLGDVMTFTYDDLGDTASTTNARGETTRATYNELARQLTNTDPTGHTISFEYDSTLTVPTRFGDEIATLGTFTSSEHGQPLTVTDPAGNTVLLTYDPYGNRTSRTDRLGRTTQYGYDGVGRQISMTEPRGGVTTYRYDLRGMTVGKTIPTQVPGHQSFSSTFDANNNLIHEESDDGRPKDYAYDALNHLTKVKVDATSSVAYTRDFRGNALTMIDESGRTTTYEYDKAGQLTKTTFPDGTVTSRTYDALGRLIALTDERGGTTSYEYEAGCACDKRVTKITDPLGRSTTTAFDAAGRRTSVTDAAGRVTSYEYNARGQVTKTTYPDGTFTLDGYDTLGRRTSRTDQMGSVTQFGYDAENQLTSVTDSLSNVTQYAYDGNGNLVSVTDGNGHKTTYGYDLVNRKTTRTLPLGMAERFVYNLFGDVTSHVDFRGKTTATAYDARGRLLTKVPDPSLGEPTVTFTYNPTGTRASMVDTSGTTTYAYDDRDRLLSKATQAGTLTYTHDPVGNLATIRSSNANGTSVDYAWDAANQLVSVTDNRVGGVTTLAYTATGRPNTLTQPNGVNAAYVYDARDQATSLSWSQGTNPAAFASWSYSFNERGQRLTSLDATGRQAAYAYDAAARLISETITGAGVGNGALSYTLDSTGNRLTRTSTLSALGAQSFTYDANDQSTTDGYDTNGNTTSSDGHAYKYDFENRLVSKDNGAVTVVYDGDGNRVAKTVGGVTTKYLIDDLNPTGFLQVLEEISGGSVQVAYTYGTNVLSQTRGSGAATSYYGYDAHGNVTFLTDSTGAVTDEYNYDAWGNVVSKTGATVNSRLYTGEELDPDLGLVNLRARQYRPGTGRFLSLDPLDLSTNTEPADMKFGSAIASIKDPYMGNTMNLIAADRSRWGGRVLDPLNWNRYVYANAKPVDLVDPSGRDEMLEEMALMVNTMTVTMHLIEVLLHEEESVTQHRRTEVAMACSFAFDGAELILTWAKLNPWVALGSATLNFFCMMAALLANGME
jgi:RHS repeat-associated protein